MGERDEAPRSYKVRLTDLERDAHTPADELVEEIGEDPAPDLVPEERRRLEAFLKYGTGG